MKNQCLSKVTACLVFSAFLFIFQSSLSTILNVKVLHSPRIDQAGIPTTDFNISPHLVYLKTNKKDLELKSTSNWAPLQSPKERQISCDRSHHSYDLCAINGPTILHPITSTLFLVDPSTSSPPPFAEKIRPYPRKWENFTMKKIKELTITSTPQTPRCEVEHNVPALVFSAGGYNGNFWHDFNDALIPLFITVNSVFPDQDFVLVITETRDSWVTKYADLLQTFSKHPIINLNNDNATHCFTSATLGLISHGFMSINPALMPTSKNFTHFRAFLDKAYGHGQRNYPPKHKPPAARPRLVLASRKGSFGRVILNQAEVKGVAEEVGFDVIVFKPTPRTPLQEAYAVVNSSHAMVGVHGAALTHSLFLRPGSVLVQVVPLGLEGLGEMCFGKSARAMGLEYMEYKVNAEESSLVEKYDKNELLIRDPTAFRGKNWSDAIMTIYLKEQNVKFELVRFKEYLKQVYKKAKQFMDKEG